MTWDRIALCITDLLGATLMWRLLSMRLEHIYVVFCGFVAVELAGSSLVLVEAFWHPAPFDYRAVWLVLTALMWVVKLWVVYSLLEAVLANLRGVLKFSKRLLNATFAAVAIGAIVSARSDISRILPSSGGFRLQSAVTAAFSIDRVISTATLIAMLVILAFVLWFPVQMPKNLVLFSFTFVLDFAFRNALLLVRPSVSRQTAGFLSAADTTLLGICFLFWTLFLTPAGQRVQMRIGHGWEPSEQKRLVEQLETMNAALLRQARKS